MTKRNELPVLVGSLLVTALLLGGGFYLFRDSLLGSTSLENAASEDTTPQTASGDETASSSRGIVLAGADGSSGKSVLRGAVSADKQAGLDALAAGDYGTAQTAFAAALQDTRNDPESLIYLNNAGIGDSPSPTIALIVPGAEDDTKLGTTQELMRGAAQAQTEINSTGGINGQLLRILIVDDNNDPDTAVDVATALVDEETVLGVIGHFSSGTTLATTDTYETGQLLLISPTSTSVDISRAGDYIFRTVPSDRLAASALADHALQPLNTKQAAIFYNSASNYSQSLKSEFETEFISGGGEIVEVFDISDANFRAATAVQLAQAEGAEVLMLALTLDPLDPLLQIFAANQNALPMLGSDSLYKYRVLSLGNQNATGLTVAVPWHILNYETTAFVSESRQLWGADVNWRTAMAYDAVVSLAEGLRMEPTREGIAAALSESSFQAEGATTTVRFLPTGDRNQPFELVEVEPGNRSGAGYDFVPID